MLDESYHYSSLLTNIEKTETDFICRLKRELDCDSTTTCDYTTASRNSSFRAPEEDLHCDLMAHMKIVNPRLQHFQTMLHFRVGYFRILNVHLPRINGCHTLLCIRPLYCSKQRYCKNNVGGLMDIITYSFSNGLILQ